MNYREIKVSDSTELAAITFYSRALYFKTGETYRQILSVDQLMELKYIGAKIYGDYENNTLLYTD